MPIFEHERALRERVEKLRRKLDERNGELMLLNSLLLQERHSVSNLVTLYRGQHEEVLRLRALLRRNGSQMSAVPTPYQPATDFSDYAAANPSYAFPGTQLDVELTALDTLTTAMLARAAEIQRDDGAIKNGVVGLDALSDDAKRGLATPTLWLTGTAYAVGNLVINTNNLYICVVAHTSGTFATDLAAAKWENLGALDVQDKVAQSVLLRIAADVVSANEIPWDTTTPTDPEGTQIATYSFTKRYSTESIVRITTNVECRASAAAGVNVVAVGSIHVDATAAAIGAGYAAQLQNFEAGAAAVRQTLRFLTYHASFAATTRTYKLRVGPAVEADYSITVGPEKSLGTTSGVANNGNSWILFEEVLL